MKEPELFLEAMTKIADKEVVKDLSGELHVRLADLMREKGDEVVFGKNDDYLLRYSVQRGDNTFSLNCHTQGMGDDLPFVSLSFESPTFNRTLVLLSFSRIPIVVETTMDGLDFAIKGRKKEKKRMEAIHKLNPGMATIKDIKQFAELVDFLADQVNDRQPQLDPVGFANRTRHLR